MLVCPRGRTTAHVLGSARPMLMTNADIEPQQGVAFFLSLYTCGTKKKRIIGSFTTGSSSRP
jgi:hypothetical protein